MTWSPLRSFFILQVRQAQMVRIVRDLLLHVVQAVRHRLGALAVLDFLQCQNPHLLSGQQLHQGPYGNAENEPTEALAWH